MGRLGVPVCLFAQVYLFDNPALTFWLFPRDKKFVKIITNQEADYRSRFFHAEF